MSVVSKESNAEKDKETALICSARLWKKATRIILSIYFSVHDPEEPSIENSIWEDQLFGECVAARNDVIIFLNEGSSIVSPIRLMMFIRN